MDNNDIEPATNEIASKQQIGNGQSESETKILKEQKNFFKYVKTEKGAGRDMQFDQQMKMISKKRIEQQGLSEKKMNVSQKINFKILKFLRSLKNSGGILNREVEKQHFQIIGDKASNWDGSKIGNQYTKYLFNVLKLIPILKPNNQFAIFCQILSLLFSILHIIVAPLLLSFGFLIQDEFLRALIQEISYTTFTFLIVVKLNRGYYDQNSIVTKRSMILKRYIKTQFVSEVATILSINYYDKSQFFFLITPILLLRLISIKDGIKIISEYFKIEQMNPDLFQLCILLLKAAILAHYSASFFHYIAYFEDQNVDTWITQRGTLFSPWYIRYLDSLYFALITMNTVGYGDITPISSKEKIFVIFMTIVACGFFAYCVNMIGSIFQSMAKKHSDLNQKKYYIQQYLNILNIPKEIQLKIINYIQSTLGEESNSGKLKQGEEILESIDDGLQRNVQEVFFGAVLDRNSIFQENFSPDFIQNLIKEMKYMTLSPGQTLYRPNQIDLRYYFVNRGQLIVFIQNDQEKHDTQLGVLEVTTLKYLKIQFQQIRRSFSDFVDLLLLRREMQGYKARACPIQPIFSNRHFQMLQNHSRVTRQGKKIPIIIKMNNQESYHQIKNLLMCPTVNEHYWQHYWVTKTNQNDADNMFGNQKEGIISPPIRLPQSIRSYYSKQVCYLCKNFSHSARNCSQVTFYPQKQRIIAKHLMPGEPVLNRLSVDRQNSKFNSVCYRNQLKISLMNYRIEKVLESNEIFEDFENFKEQYSDEDILNLEEVSDQNFFEMVPQLIYDESTLTVKAVNSNEENLKVQGSNFSEIELGIDQDQDQDQSKEREEQTQEKQEKNKNHQNEVSKSGRHQRGTLQDLSMDVGSQQRLTEISVQSVSNHEDEQANAQIKDNQIQQLKSNQIEEPREENKFLQHAVLKKKQSDQITSANQPQQIKKKVEFNLFSEDEENVPDENLCIYQHGILSKDNSFIENILIEEINQASESVMQNSRDEDEEQKENQKDDGSENQSRVFEIRAQQQSNLFTQVHNNRVNPIKTLVQLYQPQFQMQNDNSTHNLVLEKIQEFQKFFPSSNFKELIKIYQNQFNQPQKEKQVNN